MAFDREKIKTRLERLAVGGVFIGTSSWKYAGWRGLLYEESRYLWRGKVSESRFEKTCLAEYAEVFKTVCVDAAYYTFPSEKYLAGLRSQVPEDFQFGLKVTDEITVRKFPNLPRFGPRAGRINDHFLNAHRFIDAFLKPCEVIRANIGVIIFEFSRFHEQDYSHGREFVNDLERFFSQLPAGWPYAIEIRNKKWLVPEYFDCLARHRVAHLFNSWDAMPSVSEQMTLPGSRTNPELIPARFLLKPGRRYEEAVRKFQPYRETREIYMEAREAGAQLIREVKSRPTPSKGLLFVNNRLEGNSLETIAAMVELAEEPQPNQNEAGLGVNGREPVY